MNRTIKALLLSLCLAAVTGSQTQAGLVFYITASGGNVVVDMSGNVNLNATVAFQGFSSGSQAISPSVGFIGIGSVPSTTRYFYVHAPAVAPIWTPFGAGTFNTMTSSSGDRVNLFTGGPFIGVPSDYISGSPLSATGTFNGATFFSLGITPGTYVTTFSNPISGISDSVTVNAVPEPSSVLKVAIAGIGLLQKRRRRS